MKENFSEIIFVLDRSGSMQGLEEDTIGGFNSLVDKQRKLKGKAYISTVLFNDFSKVIHDRVDIKDITYMTRDDYVVGGCTALFDAIGDAICHISDVHKEMKDVPDKTLFVITTDGKENSSHEYSLKAIKSLIEAKKELGWEFIFLGANIDAIKVASDIGISRDRASNYHSDSHGTRCNYMVINEVISDVRNNKKIRDDWAKDIKK